MFEPLDAGLVSSVRRWQAPRLGTEADGVSAVTVDVEGDAPDAAIEAALQARFEEGRAQGLAEGRAAANAAAHDEANRLIAAFLAERDRRDAALEDELLALARAMARLILRRELDHDAGMMRDLVREALARLPLTSEGPRVRLHPDDAAAVTALVTTDEAERLVPDPALARGDCRVESGASTVEAGIDACVARIAAGGERFESSGTGAPARAES